jgi:hypothetical protein
MPRTSRSFRTVAAVPFIGLLLLPACGGRSGGAETAGWVGTRETVDGTTTVRTLSGSVWGAEGRLVEEWTIGTETRGENDLLGEVYGIALCRDRVLVLDRSWYTVRVFDREGTYLERFGRQGNGPGELQFPTALAVDPVTDEILVRESVNGNTHLFSPSGEYLRTLHPQLQGGLTANEILLLRVTRAGVPILSNFNYRRSPEGEKGYLSTFRLFRLDPEGQVAETTDLPVYDHPDYELRAYVDQGRSYRPEAVPFGPQDEWSVTHEGALVTGYAADYRFEIRYPDGRMTVIERVTEPVRVEPEEKAWHIRRVETLLRSFDPAWVWKGPPVPDAKPWYSALLPDHSGRIWVLREGPGRCAAGEQEWTADRFFEVFEESSGRFLGSVPVPEGLSIAPEPWIEGDVFIAPASGPQGEPLVRKYRLELPDGAIRP